MKKNMFVMLTAIVLLAGVVSVQAQDMKAPKPAVEEVFTLTGEFVRLAYNNEGFVTLGYRTADQSQGDEWMLLEVGVTVRSGTKGQKLGRDAFSLQLPDGSKIALATQKEFGKAGHLAALNRRASMVRDSINYFPSEVTQACSIGFFADPVNRAHDLSFDSFGVNSQRGCRGRLFFHLPDGIATGQYFLNVRFEESVVQVPFRIMTHEERKMFHKHWKELKKQHDAMYEQ